MGCSTQVQWLGYGRSISRPVLSGGLLRHLQAMIKVEMILEVAVTNRRTEADSRVTLGPLTPEEALRALLAVKPEDDPVDDAHPSPEDSAEGR